MVRNRQGNWTKLLLSEPKAVVFASVTLNALAENRGTDLHTAVLYVRDDEDADAILERLSTSTDASG